ncbi:MAG TPA: peptidylprolyl isomerase [Gammaproteobacteria bacterium]|nr:peptidylprolyl isomerase [Gammaproteobacteria bacterium]
MSENPQVTLTTRFGDIVIALDAAQAPTTVENFLRYVSVGFFDNTLFHRVIPGFMIQGGGMNEDMSQKKGHEPIQNEANNGLKNVRGSIAMARTSDPHSASSQFFINLKDNAFLDFKSESSQGWGYAVFGQVLSGMDVVDTIAKQKTGPQAGHQDVPVEPILIEKITLNPI